MRPAQKSTKSAKSITATGKAFTEEEGGAIRDRVREMKAGKGEGESVVLAKIAEMREPDRTMAKRLHTIIKETAPALTPRLWYGMPAYSKDDKIWPTGFALKGLTATEEARISALVKKAVS